MPAASRSAPQAAVPAAARPPDDAELYCCALLHGQYNKRCRTELPADFGLARYAVTGMGLKHRIHPLAASIALDQLGHLDEYLTGRARVAGYMMEQLDNVPGIVIPLFAPNVRSSWYGLILRYRSKELRGLPIERFYEALHAEARRKSIDRARRARSTCCRCFRNPVRCSLNMRADSRIL